MSTKNVAKKSSNPNLPFQNHEKLISEKDDVEMRDLAAKSVHSMQYLDKKKERFAKELIKLQDGIKYNENQLLENNRKSMEEQKKFNDEVKKLNSENENLKKDIETISIKHLKALESEIELIQISNLNLQYQNKRYELELRHAIKIVASLNQIVANYNNRKASENFSVMTQTNWNEDIIDTMPEVIKLECSPGGDPRYQNHLNSGSFV